MKNYISGLILLIAVLLCTPALATHIQYVNIVDANDLPSFTDQNPAQSWEHEFDLINDVMPLWEISTHYDPDHTSTPDPTTANYTGSYNPLYDLHYVTLRINPNKTYPQGTFTSNYLQLKINDIPIIPTIVNGELIDWSNPIRLYDWGVPGDTPTDLYNIVGSNYKIKITLTGLPALLDLANAPDDKYPLEIDNVNLEGCFDAAPVPEPSTIILMGIGLLGLAGYSRKQRRKN